MYGGMFVGGELFSRLLSWNVAELAAGAVGVQWLALCALWRWRWRDYLLPEARAAERPADPQPEGGTRILISRPLKASIVVPSCNAAKELEETLPALLEQEFEDYEVIVVDEASTDDTQLVLQRLESRYSHLRHTFVPASARYVSRSKLAVTLGIRAARAPWVVLTTAGARPVGPQWLARLAKNFTDEYDFVLGYANYDAEGHGLKRAIYERMRRQLMLFRAARSGAAIGADKANMAVRRGWFLANKGYADNLTVPLGEDDLLVASLSRPGRTALGISREAVVEEAVPEVFSLHDERVCRREVIRHWSKRGYMYLRREGAATGAAYVLMAVALIYVAVRSAGYVAWGFQPSWLTVTDVLALLSWLTALLLPYGVMRRTARRLGVRRFNAFFMMGQGVAQPWRTLSCKIVRWCRRHDFVRR